MLKSATALKKTDDLFENSSMSFGEHLEELRKALAKVFIWILIGTIVGMLVAKPVLHYIQEPLRQKIEVVVHDQAKALWEAEIGMPMPPDIEKVLWEYNIILQPEIIDLDSLKAAMDEAQGISHLIPANIRPRNHSKPAADNKATPNAVASKPSTGTDTTPAGASAKPTGASESGANETAGPTKTEKSDTALADNSPAEAQTNNTAGTAGLVEYDLMRPLATATQANRMAAIWRGQRINAQTEAFGLQDGFMIWMKAGIVVGIIIASPGIFWHIWEFVAAGLYPHERKQVYFYVPFSVVLFLSGVFFAFFFIFPIIIEFLLEFNASVGAGTTARLNDYVSLALLLPLGFGISFQLPLVMLIAGRIGVASPRFYLEHWKVAVLVEAFLSMILTPSGDVTSMLGMFVPLVLLYFFGIGLCKWIPRSNNMAFNGYDPVG